MSRSGVLARHLSMSRHDIVITGATGVIGRRTVTELVRAGHSVRAVTRSAEGHRLIERLGARAVAADVFDEASLTAAFAGADTVINLLTHIPSAARMETPRAWAENDRLRRSASAAIARAAQAAGARRLVQESLAFLYADGGNRWLDEDAPVAGGVTTATALVAEANASEHFAGETVVLRFGLFIGPDSDLTLTNIEGARAGVSPSLGRRDAYLPTVWLDDAATAVVAALEVPGGIYNVADADPPRRGEIDRALGAVVGRESLRPAVDAVPEMFDPVARSQRVSSARLQIASGWRPRVRGGTAGWALIAVEKLAA
jgi:nucleoside-diphosphate-sugar epimerase